MADTEITNTAYKQYSGEEWRDVVKDCNTLEKLMHCLEVMPPTLTSLRRGITLVLQWIWSNPGNFGMPDENIKCTLWDPDKSESGLEIQPDTSVDPGNSTHVPGILISFDQGATFSQPWLEQTSMLSSDFSTRNVVSIMTAIANIQCRSFNGDIVSLMQDVVVLGFHTIVYRLYQVWPWLQRISVKSQDSPQYKSLGEGTTVTKFYEGTVILEIEMNPRFRVGVESVRLKDYSLNSNFNSHKN